jgi:hypothetical protein
MLLKKVEFKANSMFFLERLERYSRKPSCEPPHGVVVMKDRIGDQRGWGSEWEPMKILL